MDKELETMDKDNSNSFKKSILEWLKTLLFSVLIVLIINNGLIVNARIPSSSMETTIMTNDRLFANRLAYINSDPERGDIVIFKYPDNPEILYVKRIIGLPEEEIRISNGQIFIDGNVLKDDYTAIDMIGTFGPYQIPKGHYFMLGDNRNNSKDSRYWENNYVAEDKIVGKVFFRYFPSFKIFN